jgi:NAD(P)-dependent dehydrogenase (short-subunit alcohol dehydrogenase family)
MDLQLTGKVVVVTQASSIVGSAIVRAVADEGAFPVIVDHDVQAGNRLHAQLTGSELIILDPAIAESSFAAMDRIAHKYGRVDALVNLTSPSSAPANAGASLTESLERELKPFYNMTHFALPHLKRSQGNIVNVAASADTPVASLTARDAVMALTREWAAELAKFGIRVNAVIYKNTPDAPPSGSERTAPGQIAAVVAFLLSARATHITAQQVFVDPYAEAGLAGSRK